jgi:hypothetical protein
MIKNTYVLGALDTYRKSQYFSLVEGKIGETLMVTPHLRQVMTINKSVIEQFLVNKKAKSSSSKDKKSPLGLTPAIRGYRPDINCFKFFDPTKGQITVNDYRPPSYLDNEFWVENEAEYETIIYKKLEREYKAPETWNELIPKVYLDFFNHLCSNDKESLEYLIDWMAVAVDPTMRNLTTLVLIANQGVGKGVFFESVLQQLFGEHNSVQLRGQDALESRFNQSFANKRVIFLDEVQLKDIKAMNRFKMFANDMMEIEQKGKDPVYIKNWANTIIAANDLDAIKLEQDDRRFSILQVTNNRLEEFCAQHDQYKTVQELRANLENLNNIKDLYNFLISHKPERVMSYAFSNSSRVDEIKDAGLAEWERASLELCDSLYREGKRTILISDFKDKVREINRHVFPPGRGRYTKLFNKYPHVGKVHQDSKDTKHYIKLLGTYDSALDVDKSESREDTKDIKGVGINIKINSKIDGGLL